MVLVVFPAEQSRPNYADDTGAVDIEVPLERPLQEIGFLAVLDVRVLVIEPVLSVGIRQFDFAFVQEGACCLVLGVQRRTGNGRVEHELVELGVVVDGVFDPVVDV